MRQEPASQPIADVENLSKEFARTASLARMREIAIELSKPGMTNKAG